MTDSTIEAIDNALHDDTVSLDAMRWTPDPPTKVKPQSVRLPEPVGEWRNDALERAANRLWLAGFRGETIAGVLDALRDMLVGSSYYVPTLDDLTRRYYSLANAYYYARDGRIRWVMCQETHDALAERYGQTRYANIRPLSMAEVDDPTTFSGEIRAIMEGNLRWGDQAQLLGIPIRIDPAARTPLFEIVPERELTGP